MSIHAVGKGEWRLIDNESTVCVVVFFESLDSPWLSVAVRCGAYHNESIGAIGMLQFGLLFTASNGTDRSQVSTCVFSSCFNHFTTESIAILPIKGSKLQRFQDKNT